MEQNPDLAKLSRTVSHALCQNEIIEMISKSDKLRFELYEGKIRDMHDVNGIKFYQGNKTIWLADYVSPDYLNISTSL